MAVHILPEHGPDQQTPRRRTAVLFDLAINVLMIACAVSVAAAAFGAASRDTARKEIVGRRLDPAVTDGRGAPTVVLVLSSTCRFCTSAMPSIRRITRACRAAAPRWRCVAVGAEPVESLSAYLRDHGVHVDAVTSAPADPIANATPRLLLTAADGVVFRVWAGRIERDERRILAAIAGAEAAAPASPQPARQPSHPKGAP